MRTRGKHIDSNSGFSLFEVLDLDLNVRVIVVGFVLLDPRGDEIGIYESLEDGLYALSLIPEADSDESAYSSPGI